MERNRLTFKLKRELTRSAPDLWDGIAAGVAALVAETLLRELDAVPSADGKLFAELKDASMTEAFKRNRGA
ncbi:hypothetical protein [Paenibacillus sp. GYB003]|uniref:hypothetical protein n=1 Tax=Paenibacillus sp. GYB003 TaxID=2994392 RepID=UPI002F96DC5F